MSVNNRYRYKQKIVRDFLDGEIKCILISKSIIDNIPKDRSNVYYVDDINPCKISKYMLPSVKIETFDYISKCSKEEIKNSKVQKIKSMKTA